VSEEVEIVNPKRPRGKTNYSHNPQQNNTVYKVILGVILVVIIAGISFYSGVNYQKKHGSTSTTTASTNGVGPGGGFGGRFSGSRTIGTVSAISATSITVTPASGSSAVTYTINSSTVISDSGQTVSYTDIQTGDTVFVSASSSTSTIATRILVNPSFGGFGGGGGTGGGSGGTTTSPNTTLN